MSTSPGRSSITLTESLLPQNQAQAIDRLQEYFAPSSPGKGYTGSRFDTWDSLGTADADRDVFTADDVLAVTFLSVRVPAAVAIDVLGEKRGKFTRMLERLGPDRDLVDVEEPLGPGTPAMQLNTDPRRWPSWSASRS